MQTQAPRIIVSITTTAGTTHQHTYEIPIDEGSQEDLYKQISRTNRRLLEGQSKPVIYLNPLAYYRSEHVISVQIDFEEFPLQEGARALGFLGGRRQAPRD